MPVLALDGSLNSSGSGNNLRLIIYLSCLISAGLFTLHLAAAAYNRAQARRLLGAIPANPPPPLLVSNSNGSAASVAQLHPMLAGNQQQQQRANQAGQQQQQITASSANNSEHTSPTYGSSSLDYSAALSANRAKQLASNSSSTNYDHLFLNQYQCVQKSMAATKQQLSVPIHLVVQLLALQLIVILLVESQNYLQRMQNRRSASLMMTFRQQQNGGGLIYGPTNEQQQLDPTLDPIGLITWSFLLAFYYLIASIFGWLASQLLEINLDWLGDSSSSSNLVAIKAAGSKGGQLRTSNSTNSSVASDKSAQYGVTSTSATNSTAFASSVNPAGSSSLYASGGNARHQLNANQLYLVETGQASCYGQTTLDQHQHHLQQTGHPFQSSTSPSSSLSSSAGEQHLSQLQHQRTSRQRISPRRAGFLRRLLGFNSKRASKSNQLNKFLVHLFPILLTGFIGWLSASRSQIINSLTYTSSLGSQLAYWPLLADCSSSALSLLLYYLPAVSLI